MLSLIQSELNFTCSFVDAVDGIPGVNFINILLTAFSNENVCSSFFLIRVLICYVLAKEFQLLVKLKLTTGFNSINIFDQVFI
jgi:hypothetical protein